jgi:hypothetical protein
MRSPLLMTATRTMPVTGARTTAVKKSKRFSRSSSDLPMKTLRRGRGHANYGSISVSARPSSANSGFSKAAGRDTPSSCLCFQDASDRCGRWLTGSARARMTVGSWKPPFTSR